MLEHNNLSSAGFSILCQTAVLHIFIGKMERSHSSQNCIKLRKKKFIM